MPLRWIRTKNHRPDPKGPEWKDDDWLLVGDDGQARARIYAYEHGPQAGRWFWTVHVWGGHAGVADDFEKAREAVKARMEALGLIPGSRRPPP